MTKKYITVMWSKLLDVNSMTHQTRSHGLARTSIGDSVAQEIMNKYDFTVSKATKQRIGFTLVK